MDLRQTCPRRSQQSAATSQAYASQCVITGYHSQHESVKKVSDDSGKKVSLLDSVSKIDARTVVKRPVTDLCDGENEEGATEERLDLWSLR